jgi:hypothetical protein
LTIIFQVGSLVAALIFVVRYAMTTWRKTPGGRNAMVLGILFAVFSVLVLARMLIPEAAGPYIRMIAWGSVFAVLCWRAQLLFRFQRDGRRSRLKGRDHETQA